MMMLLVVVLFYLRLAEELPIFKLYCTLGVSINLAFLIF